MDVYHDFIDNYPKLEATKLSFNRWMDKLGYTHATDYHSALKRSELSWRHGGTLNTFGRV